MKDIVEEFIFELGLFKLKKDKRLIQIKECPFCKNGKSNRPRSYILYDNQKAVFYCHNDGCIDSKSLGNVARLLGRNDLFLKYMKYINNEEKNIEEDDNDYVDDESYESLDLNNLYIKIKNKKYKLKLSKHLLNKHKEYLKNRKIYNHKYFFRNIYNDNLVIPYFDKKLNKVYNLQEKDFKSGKYFFLNIVDKKEFKFDKVYNLFNVNENKNIIILEGVLDTFFVNNSISIGGINNYKIVDDLKYFHNKEIFYFIQDNDKAGKSKIEDIIDKGHYVFMWKYFLRYEGIDEKIKDINDLYEKDIFQEKLDFSYLKKYFTNNIFFKGFI